MGQLLTQQEIEAAVVEAGLVVNRPQGWNDCMRMQLPGGDRYDERVMLCWEDRDELDKFLLEVKNFLNMGYGHLIEGK